MIGMTPPDEDFDRRRLAECYRHAMRYSPDTSSKNCAMLIDPSKEFVDVRSVAYNTLPPFVVSLPRRLVAPEKYLYTEHAERMAIYQAALRGVSTRGLWMYCPWAACADCARAIICAGITRVIRHELPGQNDRNWTASIHAGLTMMTEAGVDVITHTFKVDPTDELQILRGGQIYKP